MPYTETAMLAVFALVIGLVIFGGTTLAAFAEGRTVQRYTTSPREAEDPVLAVRVLGVESRARWSAATVRGFKRGRDIPQAE